MSDATHENNVMDMLFPPTPNSVFGEPFREGLFLPSAASSYLKIVVNQNFGSERDLYASMHRNLMTIMLWIVRAIKDLSTVLEASLLSSLIADANVQHSLENARLVLSEAILSTQQILNEEQPLGRSSLNDVLSQLSLSYLRVQNVVPQFLNRDH